MTKRARKPFADTAARKDAAAAHDARAEAFARLIGNADFREWMFAALHALCAFEPEIRDTTEFERGIRAAGSFIRRELLQADGAPQFFADLDRRYWSGVRRGIIEAKTKRDNER